MSPCSKSQTTEAGSGSECLCNMNRYQGREWAFGVPRHVLVCIKKQMDGSGLIFDVVTVN